MKTPQVPAIPGMTPMGFKPPFSVDAAATMAGRLMEDGPDFKAGYTFDNALIAVRDYFGLTDAQRDDVRDEMTRRHFSQF